MKITYIHHSCFSVELDNCILLFDYYKGELPAFDRNKNLYVFSSHSHHDHFSKSVFKLEKKHPNVTYILSDDIKTSKSPNRHFIGANKDIIIDNLKIKTLDSTDIGVAFLIKVENKTIYHAGDLNWWHWEGENTPEENKLAGENFRKFLNEINGEDIDLAFVPLDPRQGELYYLGFDYFMRNTNTKFVFPMHLWNKYSIIKVLKNSQHSIAYKDRIFEINQEGEAFII